MDVFVVVSNTDIRSSISAVETSLVRTGTGFHARDRIRSGRIPLPPVSTFFRVGGVDAECGCPIRHCRDETKEALRVAWPGTLAGKCDVSMMCGVENTRTHTHNAMLHARDGCCWRGLVAQHYSRPNMRAEQKDRRRSDEGATHVCFAGDLLSGKLNEPWCTLPGRLTTHDDKPRASDIGGGVEIARPTR